MNDEKGIELVEQEGNIFKDSPQQPSPIQMVQKYRFFTQLRLMIKKNYLLFRRQMFMSIFLFLSPLFICLLILFWQYVVNSFTQFLVLDPPINPILKAIPPCTSIMGECTSIGYFIIGDEQSWIQNIMKRVAQQNNLEFDKDVKLLLKTQKPSEIQEYLLSHSNQTQIGVIFCTDKWMIYEDQPSLSIPCSFERIEKKIVFYTIIYNYTLLYKSPYLSDMKMSYPKDAYATSLKVSLDNAIMREFSGQIREEDEDYLYITQQEFPKIPVRFVEGIDIAGNYGAFYFFAPFLLNFLILINELLQEKGKKLRQGASVMGLTHFAYWVSWTITAQAIVMILTLNLLFCGYVFNLDFFTKTPFWILFVLYNTFGFSISLVAFFIATISPDAKNGYTIAYAFILTALLMQICFTQAGMAILFYRSDVSDWVKVVRFVLSLYPAFKYSLIYSDISVKSCRHYSLEENRWVDGEGFTYSDLWETNAGKVQLDKFISYESPNAIENYIHLLLACLFYILLTYYFDHILESNRGKSDSLLFCITNPISKCKRKKAFKIPIANIQYQSHSPSDTAQVEKEKVIKNYGTFVDGLRIVGLSKTYYKYPFQIASDKDVHALKDVYFEMNSGECLALLGHNGAGKTTLIGLLTGMFKASRGTAQILDYDINDDMDKIRSRLGVCPQFDILWNQLTAAEHLRMFAAIKGIPSQYIEQEVDQRLRDVELLHVKNHQVQTFSGGMKRRVSLAISAIGDPKVIIMDEPTTGMDPRARRQVWSMIKTMKTGRVVLLTTHAMEEADVLADRIAVMAEGQLKAIGTSLYLKNNFSDGYRVNIVCEDVESCLLKLRQVLGQFKVLDTSGGSIVISISFDRMMELRTLFEVLEKDQLDQNQKELKSMIKDWGLSHATLEEVFMKVTRKCE